MFFCFLLLDGVQMALPALLKLIAGLIIELWCSANPRPWVIDTFFALFDMLITRRSLINQLTQVVRIQSMEHVMSRDLES